MSTLESALLRMGLAEKKGLRLSERHLAYFTYKPASKGRYASLVAGGDRFYMNEKGGPYSQGGDMDMYVSTLARRVGAVDHALVKGKWAMPRDTFRASHVHLKSARFLPPLANIYFYIDGEGKEQIIYDGSYPKNRDVAKQHIMRYGSINLSYHSDDKYYDSKHSSHYTYSEGKYWKDPDHEVAVVGWDDDFPKSNFKKTLRHNGAWIVKNSWGKDFGDDGYMYLSYWDKSIMDATALIPEQERYRGRKTRHNTNAIYQYDGVMFGDGKFCTRKPVYAANMFKVRSNFELTSVGISTFKPNTRVWVSINKNSKSGRPLSGQQVCSKTYRIKYPGYNVVQLPKSVYLSKNSRFTIRCMMKSNSGRWYYLPFETQLVNLPKGYKNAKIDVSEGQSFVRWGYKKNGRLKYSSWKDITKQKNIVRGQAKMGNAVIKGIGRLR